MSVMDKFLNAMKLNDEEDYDDDEFFDDDELEEDYEERPARKNLFKKEKTYEEDYEDSPVNNTRNSKPAARMDNKVTFMRQPVKKATGMEVCVIKPTAVDDSREITETLLSNRTVILNLEGIDLDIAQRIIDFTSGATFAIDGNLQKISNYIFLVTPRNVDISGDLQDLLNSSFDVPSIKNRY